MSCTSVLHRVWHFGFSLQQQVQAYHAAHCRFFLPPIIFSAGLSVRKKSFFRNFVSIASLGILGTYVALTFIVLTLLLYRKCFGFLNMQVRSLSCLRFHSADQALTWPLYVHSFASRHCLCAQFTWSCPMTLHHAAKGSSYLSAAQALKQGHCSRILLSFCVCWLHSACLYKP